METEKKLNEMEDEEYQLSQVMEWLMPWLEKTDGRQTIADWQNTLPVTMMVKLLELWLDDKGRHRLRMVLQFYHPLDRAAMAYALMVYVLRGHKMTFKTAVANHHFREMCQLLDDEKQVLRV